MRKVTGKRCEDFRIGVTGQHSGCRVLDQLELIYNMFWVDQIVAALV